jgi:adenosylmethionine-8-amino-7-oxononanoate aminotransferase
MQRHETFPLIPIARGEGVWLIDFDGKRYLDAVSSWWVNLFGHANPRINAALIDQLGRLEHVMLAGFTHQPVVELSERLAALSGLGHAFYGSDGASATEIALKMSFQYWQQSGAPQKSRFIHLEHSYHGETLGALAVTHDALGRPGWAFADELAQWLTARGVQRCHLSISDERAQCLAAGFGKGFFGGKALGQQSGRVAAGLPVRPFGRRQDAAGKALAVAVQRRAHAGDVHQVGANAQNHAVRRASTISAFISRTARSKPVNSAWATMAWPMFSSRISAMAATGCTLW